MTRMSLLAATLIGISLSIDLAAATESDRTDVAFGPFTIVVAEGQNEPASIGSYTVRVYRNDPQLYGDFIDGAVAKRDGSITKAWGTTLTEREDAYHLMVWCQGAGSGSHGSLHVYEIDKDGRVRNVPIPQPRSIVGYMGHDRFFTEANTLFREFPIYKSDDPNSRPTGGHALYKFDWQSKSWVSSPPKTVKPQTSDSDR